MQDEQEPSGTGDGTCGPPSEHGDVANSTRIASSTADSAPVAPRPVPTAPISPPLLLLLDHANIPFDRSGPTDLVRAWLDCLISDSRIPHCGLLSIAIRAYGGWFLGDSVSDERFRAAEMYQRECPLLFEHRGVYCRVRFEFADALLAGGHGDAALSNARITHTVGTRTKPPRIWPVADPPPCTEPDCELPSLRRWLRRQRGCPRRGCERDFAACFRRREQKQVDVHLAIDILTAVLRRPGPIHLGVASDDMDLLPAILSAGALRGAASSLTVLRFDTTQTYMDDHLAQADVKIVRLARTEDPT